MAATCYSQKRKNLNIVNKLTIKSFSILINKNENLFCKSKQREKSLCDATTKQDVKEILQRE